MAFEGAARAAIGPIAGPAKFSCADVPFNGTNLQAAMDAVLTPDDMNALDGLLTALDNHIAQQAAARGYAYFSLGTLFERSDLKPAQYSVISQLTSQLPYGPYTSLDGIHPNPLGHTLLALAAGTAINRTYGSFGVHAAAPTMPSLADRMPEVELPAVSLERAKRFAKAHAGEKVSPCPMPGGCEIGTNRVR
jgi:hypothetical protein